MTSGTTEQNFGFLLSDTARLMRKRFAQRARDLNMTGAQWRVLLFLARLPGANQATLADFLEVEPITLTRLVDRMEAAGLIRREIDPNDRRARNLYMTDKAIPVMEELRKISASFLQDLFAGIADRDFEIARAVLSRIRSNLSETGTEFEIKPVICS